MTLQSRTKIKNCLFSLNNNDKKKKRLLDYFFEQHKGLVIKQFNHNVCCPKYVFKFSFDAQLNILNVLNIPDDVVKSFQRERSLVSLSCLPAVGCVLMKTSRSRNVHPLNYH